MTPDGVNFEHEPISIHWFIIDHQICDLLRVIGMRDRLRCPRCGAVGTWKPHGGWLDDSKASGRRWICKWCGLYKGRPFNKGEVRYLQAFIDPQKSCWRIAEFYDGELPPNIYVPKDLVNEANPWRG